MADEGIPRARRRLVVLLLILVVAAAVRFHAIDFGLPHTRTRPDEQKVVRIVESPWMAFHPRTFAYPSLYKYAVLGAYGVHYGVGRLTGRFEEPRDLVAEYALDPSTLYLLNRLLAATLGTTSVLLLYVAGRRLAGDRTALVAAGFLALCFLHARDSHFGVTDVPMTASILAGLVFVLRAFDGGRLRDWALAGLFCGLATSTKYSGAFLAVPAALAYLHGVVRTRPRPSAVLRDPRLPVFALVALVAFFAGTPYALLDTTRFLADVSRDAHHLATGHGVVIERGWTYHLHVGLPAALGWPLFLASLAGCVVLVRRHGWRGGVVLAFPFVYYAIAGSGYAVFLRYTMPLLPFLCLAAACLVDALAARFRTAGTAVAVVLAVLLVAPSAYRLVRVDILLSERDNRLVATEWVLDHVPPESSIHQTGSRSARLQLPETFDELERGLAWFTRRWGRGWLASSQPGRARGEVAGYVEWSYDAEQDRFAGAGALRRTKPDWVLVQESALPRYEKPLDPALRELLERSYELVRSFVAHDPEDERNRYDPIDAFYVPWAGFHGVERPGPNVHVYRRRSDG